MFLSVLGIVIFLICGYFYWYFFGWCCFLMNVVVLYMVGIVIYDVFYNLVYKDCLINVILGYGSVLFLGFVFLVFI